MPFGRGEPERQLAARSVFAPRHARGGVRRARPIAGRCPRRRAARLQRCRTGKGDATRCTVIWLAGRRKARSRLRSENPRPDARVHVRRHPDTGARHRSGHGHLQRPPQRRPRSLSLLAIRSHGECPPEGCVGSHPSRPLFPGAGVPRLPGADAGVRGRGRDEPRRHALGERSRRGAPCSWRLACMACSPTPCHNKQRRSPSAWRLAASAVT